MVVGPFNEVSGDVHILLDQMADSRVAVVGRREGRRQVSVQEKGLVVGQLWRN